MPEDEDDVAIVSPVASTASAASINLPPPMMASPIKPLRPSEAIIEEEPYLEENENNSNDKGLEDQQKPFNNDTTTNNSSSLEFFEDPEPEMKNSLNQNDTSVLLPFDSNNPWDLVPDQPAKNKAEEKMMANKKLEIISLTKENDSDWPISSSKSNNDFLNNSGDSMENNGHTPLMVDPFDADWVNLAIKSSNNTRQPF